MPTIGQLVVELVANTAKFNTSMDEVNSKLRDVSQNTSSLRQIFNTFAGVSLAGVAREVAELNRRNIDMDIDAIQQRTGDAADVTLNLQGRAATFASWVIPKSTRARVHCRRQHE